jgi:hypothetical protein
VVVSGTDFTCKLPKQSDVLNTEIALSYIFGGNTKVLSSNTIPYAFVKQGTITLKTNTNYDYGVTEPNWPLAFQASGKLTPNALNTQIVCKQTIDNIVLTTTPFVGTNYAYTCLFTETVSRPVTVALWATFYSSSLLLSTNTVSVPFIKSGAISLSLPTSNGNLLSSNFVTTFTLPSYIPTTAAFQKRIYCLINSDTANGKYTIAVVTAGTTASPTSTFKCTMQYATGGLHAMSLWIAPLTGSTVSAKKISTNTIPLVLVETVSTSNVYPQPYSLADGTSTTINMPLAFITAHPGKTIDNYFLYGNSVKYSCLVDKVYYDAIWNAGNSTLTCTVNKPVATKYVNAQAAITTVATSTTILWTPTATKILYYSLVGTRTLTPFVVTHTGSNTIQTSIVLYTEAQVYTCTNLYLSYKDGATTKLASLTCGTDKRTITATTTITQFSATNTTTVPMSLAYGVGGTAPEIVSDVPVYLTFIRTPIDFVGAPSVLQPSTLKAYNLSFAVPPAASGLTYAVTYLQDTTAIAGEATPVATTIACDFTKTLPSCTLPSFTAKYIPIKLQYSLTITRGTQPALSIDMSPRYYKRPINVLNTLPYFTDTQNTATTAMSFTLTTDTPIHPMFTFSCVKTGSGTDIVTAGRPTDYTQVTCLFTSRNVDHTGVVSLRFGSTLPDEASTFPGSLSALTSVTASGTAGTMDFNTLTMSPPFVSGPDTTSTYTLVYNSTKANYIVPNTPYDYRSIATTISLDTASVTFSATISSGVVQFLKNKVVTKTVGSSLIYDIQNIVYSIMLPTGRASTLTATSVVYQPNLIVTKFPRAVLRGQDAIVTIDFGTASTLQISLDQPYLLYCKTSAASMVTYNATAIDSTTLVCSVMYNASQVVSNSYVPLFPFLQVPSLSSSDVILSKNLMTDDIAKLYYLDKAPIALSPSTQAKLQFTNILNTIRIQFNGTLPSVTDMQTKYMYCLYTFVTTNATTYVQAAYDSFAGGSYYYNCKNKFGVGNVGRVLVTLHYRDLVADSAGTSFQVSTNSVELVYTDKINLQNMVPLAIRVNLTADTTVQSSFIYQADYGDVEYYAKYQFNGVPSAPVVYLPAVLSGSSFSFSLNSSVTGSISIGIVMDIGGYNQTISNNAILFSFVEGNFLTPSWATLAGGSVSYVRPYSGVQSDQIGRFVDDAAITFPCKYWSSTLGPQLNCTMPTITKYTPFQSFFARVGTLPLSMKYVLIDSRTITVALTVFPTTGVFNITVVMNSAVTVGEDEGNAVLQINAYSLSDALYDTIGVINNTRTVNRLVSALDAGTYNLTLMYYNPNLFETRSMAPFTNSALVTFIDPAPIQIGDKKNAVYSGVATSVVITLTTTQLTSALRASLKCKFDSPFVDVTSSVSLLNRNQVTCNVIASRPVISKVSIWYVNSNTPGGEFNMSTNAVEIVFMELLSARSNPWATLNSEQRITLNTSITSDISLFSSYLTYSCLIYDPLNPNPAGSFLNNDIFDASRVAGTPTFNCTVKAAFDDSKYFLVVLYATTSTKQFIAVSGPVPVYFIKRVQLNTIIPFVQQMERTTDTVKVTITTKAPYLTYTAQVLTDNQLYCKYTTVNQQSWLYSVATRLTNTSVSCFINATHQSQPTELIDVRLWYNGGNLSLPQATGDPFSFDLSANNVTIMFVKQPIKFTDTNQTLFSGLLYRDYVLNRYLVSNFQVPKQSLPFTYAMSMNVSGSPRSNLDCEFTPGSIAKCIIIKDSFAVDVVPATLNFSLSFTDSASETTVSWPITSLVYTEDTSIVTAYPYALSFTEYKSTGAQVKFEVDRPLSKSFAYRCVVVSNITGSSYLTSATLQNTSIFTCIVKSFSRQESVLVSLQYVQSSTSYPASVFAMSSNNATLSFVSPLRMDTTTVSVPTSSVTVSLIDPLPMKPTLATGYDISLVMVDRAKKTPLENCTIDDDSYMSCSLPNGLYDFPSTPWYAAIDLYINNLRSLTLAPKLTFITPPVFKSILPSAMISQVTAPVATSYITIQGSNFFASASDPIIITYSCDTCTSVKNGTSTQTELCSLVSSTQISCPAPQYTFNADSTSCELALTFNMAGLLFEAKLKAFVYDSGSIVISTVTGTDCSPYKASTVIVTGTNFMNASIYVQYVDYASYNVITKAGVQFISDTTVSIQSPLLWNSNFKYPRSIWFSLSFDNGVNYIKHPAAVLNYASPPKVSFYPTSLLVGRKITNMTISNFPSVDTKNDTRIRISLVGTNVNILLQCNSAFTLCNSTTALPSNSTVLSLKTTLVNSTGAYVSDVSISFASDLQVYQFATATRATPTHLYSELSDDITIYGDFKALVDLDFTISLRQNAFVRPLTVKSFNSTFVSLSGLSSAFKAVSTRRLQAAAIPTTEIIVSTSGSSTTEVLLTSGGVNPLIIIHPAFILTQIINNDFEDDEGTAFSFQPTRISIYGSNLPSLNATEVQNLVRVNFKNLFDVTYRASQLSLVLSAGRIQLIAPAIANLTSDTTLRYPLSVTLSISFNAGEDYSSIEISYVNQFHQPLLTSITPAITPRQETLIGIQGKFLSSAITCTFDSHGAIPLYVIPANKTITGNSTSDYQISCLLPQWIVDLKFITDLDVYVATTYKETSAPINLLIQETLSIVSVTPSSGSTIGGNTIIVYVTGALPDQPLYLRFSESISPLTCSVWNFEFDSKGTTSINCTAATHANGKTRLMLSYNQINWYMQGGIMYNPDLVDYPVNTLNYEFIPCDPGYYSLEIADKCQPCPAGTYKPTAGIYACIACANGTYNAYEAQKNCTICPLHASSRDNATSLLDCVCNPGFYTNPNTPNNPYLDTCLSCPIGAVCAGYNTTVPAAKSGYWHSSTYPYKFYQCFPESACPGGGVNNCSIEYTASLCGLCANGYYKWRNECRSCSPNAWLYLIVAVAALVIITLAFFAISSAKASHLASISIAFSFWQIIAIFAQFDVKFPTTISNSFTAASVLNLNIDFLSLQCVFVEMSFTTKWILVALLPFYFLVAFFVLYLLGELRTLIVNRTGQCIKIKYWPFREEYKLQEKPTAFGAKFKFYTIRFFKQALTFTANILIWTRNFGVWMIKEKATRGQMSNFRNKIINSYTAYVFSFHN